MLFKIYNYSNRAEMEYHAVCNSIFNYSPSIKYEYDVSQFDYIGNVLVKALLKKGSKLLCNYKSASCIGTTPAFQIACFVGQRYYIIEEIIAKKTIKKKDRWTTESSFEWKNNSTATSFLYDGYVPYTVTQAVYQPIITTQFNDINITYNTIDENG